LREVPIDGFGEHLRCRRAEAHEHHGVERLRLVGQHAHHRGSGDLGRVGHRVAVDARGNGREGDAAQAVRLRQTERIAVAGGEQIGLAVTAAAPHRADGVDDVPRG
jgi:hypothetical protein